MSTIQSSTMSTVGSRGNGVINTSLLQSTLALLALSLLHSITIFIGGVGVQLHLTSQKLTFESWAMSCKKTLRSYCRA